MGTSRLGVFVQVRLASTRLAKKALLTLGDLPMIEHVMRALRPVPAAARALLTVADDVEVLRPCADAWGFDVFAGPEQDVLQRFLLAARSFGVDRVVRATGDSPLVSTDLCHRILELHEDRRADLSHYLSIPFGTGVEIVETAALETAAARAGEADEREHITTYLHRHAGDHRIHQIYASRHCTYAGADVSVDSPRDYERVTRIYADLYEGAPLEVEAVVGWLRRNPQSVRLREIVY